jgi:protease I
VAVICHAPWTLIDAGVAGGRTLTSYPSVWTDLNYAGAIVSSRSPADLDPFCATLVEEFAKT